MKTISQEDIIESVKNENPWWETSQIHEQFAKYTPRPYIQLFYPLVTERSIQRAVVLMGPRRVGKTVMIHHTIQRLMDDGVNPKHICYVSTDHPLYNGIGLETFLKYFQEATGTDFRKTECYIFFDEIQYLRDWEKHLKAIVDRIPTIKCVVSGSAAAALKLKSNESGAGRFTDFLLPPLTFHEYLFLTNNKELLTQFKERIGNFLEEGIKELNKKFVEYINFGGYPEVILSDEMKHSASRYIKSDIIDKVLLRDIPQLYGIRDIQELNALFTTLAFNTAEEISLEGLSQSSGVQKNTIKRYIEYLEAAFLIKTVKRIDESGKRFQRNNRFKVYLTNPSMRSALYKPVQENEDITGHLVETAIFSQWFHSDTKNLFYANYKKKEIDLVRLDINGKVIGVIESKWSDRIVNKKNEFRHIIDFCHLHNVNMAKISTKTIVKEELIENVCIQFVPSSLYCLRVGQDIIGNKIVDLFSNRT